MGAFGLRGQVKVKPLTDFLERLEEGARLRLNENWVTVEGAKWHKNQLLLRLSGVKDLTTAEGLQWAYLEAKADERPELDEDEYVTADLVGLLAQTSDGETLGTVSDVMLAPAHDVLIVGEIMIPAVKQFVKKVDLEGRTITVELIPGMRPGE